MDSNKLLKGETVSGDKERIVTLVGVKQARVGYRFIFLDVLSEYCNGCERRPVCLGNLEAKRVYEVIKVRGKVFPCKVHADGVSVVEVVESDIIAAVPKTQAFEGAILTFQSLECEDFECPMYEICHQKNVRFLESTRTFPVLRLFLL